MIKFFFALWLVIASSLVYADYAEVDPNATCVFRAQVYAFVVRARNAKLGSETQILRKLSFFLEQNGVTPNEIAEIMKEAKIIYEDKTLTEEMVFLKYLQKCGGVQI